MDNDADNNELSALVKECLGILDENVSVLTDIEFDLQYERDDEMTPDMGLHDLYDMADDVAESAKLKRAEFGLSQRQLGNL